MDLGHRGGRGLARRFRAPGPWSVMTSLEAPQVKALVKAKAEPGLWMLDVPEPAVGPGEVLVKVLRTGSCGTDLHIRWSRPG